jgi:hypothetical protein
MSIPVVGQMVMYWPRGRSGESLLKEVAAVHRYPAIDLGGKIRPEHYRLDFDGETTHVLFWQEGDPPPTFAFAEGSS